MSLKFNFSAAAPFDQPAPVRIEREIGSILRAANRSGKDLQMCGVFPASIRSLQRELRISHDARVVHISSHASGFGLELENDFGMAEVCSLLDVAEIFAVSPPTLLFLSGCHTEPIADEIHKTTRGKKPWIISTTRDISDNEVNEFVELFYSTFYSQADVESSFDFARTALSSKNAWYLHRGETNITTDLGKAEVDRSLLDVLNWTAILRSIIPRANELYEIYSFLKGPTPARWITGAPRSGVSTLLKVVTLRYSWMFDYSPIILDCTEKSFMEVQETVTKAILQRSTSTFEQAIQMNSALICFDNFDQADVRLQRELIGVIQKLERNCRSRILIGSQLDRFFPDLGTQPLILGELTEKETNNYLNRELDNSIVSHLHDVIPYMNRLPGRLFDFVSDVKNGASLEELRNRQKEGDPRAGLERQFEKALSDESSRRLLQILSVIGTPIPRTVARQVFMDNFHPDMIMDDDLTGPFEDAVRNLRYMQFLLIENIQRSTNGVPESYFVCSSDLTRLIRDRFRELSPSHLSATVNQTLIIALSRANSGGITPEYDALWIRQLVNSAIESNVHTPVVELGLILFQVQGTFRQVRDTDGEELVALMLSVAQLASDWDSASYFGLLLGEIRYSSGRLKAAEEVFRTCLTFECPNSRRLQFLRALGQLSYRKGDYSKALEFYEEALQFSNKTDEEFIASVKHHQSKALFRLGNLDLALQGFAQVAKIREEAGNIRGTLKAKHEEARVMQTLGRLEEAEKIYQLVIAGATAIQFEAMLPGSNYQLALLELSRNRLEEASVLIQNCRQLADRYADPFWTALTLLASAMLHYDRGITDIATTELLKCLEISQERGYYQIIQDSKAWLTHKLASSYTDYETFVKIVVAQYPGLSHSKAEKAIKYSSEPERIKSVNLVFDSSSAERQISWEKSSGWHCSCDYWTANKICSHIVAFHLQLPNIH